MSFSEAIETCLRKYADFKGRASRSEFWWFVLFYYGVMLLPAIIVGVTAEAGDVIPSIAGAIGLAFLALLLPYVAAGVRRLHDTDKSGWWWFISLIPFGSIILIVFWASEGSAGWNQYGPPLDGASSTSEAIQARKEETQLHQ